MQCISEEQWEPIRRHFPGEYCPDDRPGHKQIPALKVLKTAHRRIQQCCENDLFLPR